jgi:hypothetical protein
MKITMGKKYTSNGRPVIIRYVDGKNTRYPVLAEFEDGAVEFFSASGACSDLTPSEYDLVEVSPYADWKIDQKIMVSEDGEDWRKRHFAGVDEEGCPLAWVTSSTSWADRPEHIKWNYARLPTPEELGDQT